MHSAIAKILSTFMSLLLLSTTTSFSIEAHSCGGELVDISFHEAQPCDMAQDEALHDLMKKIGCCQDHELASIGQDDVQPTIHDLDFSQQVFVVAFTQSFFLIQSYGDAEATSVVNDALPPPKRQPLYIQYESIIV